MLKQHSVHHVPLGRRVHNITQHASKDILILGISQATHFGNICLKIVFRDTVMVTVFTWFSCLMDSENSLPI